MHKTACFRQWRDDLRVVRRSSARGSTARRSVALPESNFAAAFPHGGRDAVEPLRQECEHAAALPAQGDAPRSPHAAIAPQELDRAIADVLSRPEYAWRMPRKKSASAGGTGFLASFLAQLSDFAERALRKIGRAMSRILDWLRRWVRPPRSRDDVSPDWQQSVRGLLFALLAVALSLLAVALYRAWRRRKGPVSATVTTPLPTAAEIQEDRVAADQLPADQWMAVAREFLRKGELRLALRAMFLAALAHLAQVQRLSIARHKSNREYLGELRRRAHDRPDVLAAFAANVRVLERIWYGVHPATPDLVEAFTQNQEVLLRQAPTS